MGKGDTGCCSHIKRHLLEKRQNFSTPSTAGQHLLEAWCIFKLTASQNYTVQMWQFMIAEQCHNCVGAKRSAHTYDVSHNLQAGIIRFGPITMDQVTQEQDALHTFPAVQLQETANMAGKG